MFSLAPIALFVYNRPDHTLKTLEFLKANTLAAKSTLFIFSDGAKNDLGKKRVNEVRDIIRELTGFYEIKIIEQSKNLGLAESVIQGASTVLKEYKKIIVLEDDLITTPDFLNFMNSALDFYEKSSEVFSVSGYSYPLSVLEKHKYSTYFSHRGSSWSWGTWLDRWETIDWDLDNERDFKSNKAKQKSFNDTCGPDLSNMLIKQFDGYIDSWAIRFAYNSFLQNKLHVLSTRNKVRNIGHDNSGTHSPKTTKYNVPMSTEEQYHFAKEIAVDSSLKKALIKFHTKPFLVRILRKLIPVKK